MGPVGAAAIELGSNLLGSFVNQALGYHANKRLMKYQAELQQQLTDRANDYNLPKNQVARLVAGNLNPNLAYNGVNSVAGSSTPHVGLNSAPSANIRLSPFEAMSQYQQYQISKQDARLQGARADYQELLNDQLRAKQPYFREMAELERLMAGFNTDLKQSQKANEWYKQEDNRRLYDVLQEMERDGSLMRSIRSQYESSGIRNDKMLQDIKNLRQSIVESQKRIEIMQKQGENLDQRTKLLQLEETLKRNGVSWSDNIFFRFLAVASKALFGVDISGLSDYTNSEEGKDPVSRGASIGGNP